MKKKELFFLLAGAMVFAITIYWFTPHYTDRVEPKKVEDPVAHVLKLYHAADEAEKNQLFDLAETLNVEANVESEAKGFKGEYISLANIYFRQGRYEKAAEARSRYLQINQGLLQLGDIVLHYCCLGDIYLAQGKYQMALENYEMSRKTAEEQAIREPHNANFTYLDPYLGNYYIQQGDYEKAIQHLRDYLNWLLDHTSMSMRIAKGKNGLAMMYYYSGEDQKAEELFRDAAGLNASAMVGFSTDLAQSLTMLGRIAEHRGQGDQALHFYQSARESLHMYRTMVFKVEEADIWNQVGRFLLGQGNLGEASKAYHEAVALRQATATATHPNCADALQGLADVSASKGDLTSATLQATQALKILDTALVPTHPRIAPTLVALISLNALTGKPDQSAPLEARLETILQKPLGPWKEDFMDTAAFYAMLLTKAGRPDAALYLEQLKARQKNRR